MKVFFGADPAQMAPAQLAAHRERLAHYEALKALDDGSDPRGPFLALEAGLRHQREWIAYWEALVPSGSASPGGSPRRVSTESA